jgi:hypothetical protein
MQNTQNVCKGEARRVARREDKEAAKKGNFFTNNNNNSNPGINPQNSHKANDSTTRRVDQIRGNPT